MTDFSSVFQAVSAAFIQNSAHPGENFSKLNSLWGKVLIDQAELEWSGRKGYLDMANIWFGKWKTNRSPTFMMTHAYRSNIYLLYK